MKILGIQNRELEGIGLFRRLLEEKGAHLEIVHERDEIGSPVIHFLHQFRQFVPRL